MRYLNKIIFINSANIRYEEVLVDGNVHFTGTQGVGKSTILRALLFFYNADKTKLGIPKEKKRFEDFYFEFANSYIIYEIVRENGAYFVIAFKSHNHIQYRFVDTAYDKDFFLRNGDEAIADWGEIHKRLPKGVYTSKIIESYEKFRDIIFGNRSDVTTEFHRFAITESQKYQNIPRTIQNIFLNSKLEADFIKDTIIHSMNDEEVSINLAYYRSQVSQFQQEYDDINIWFTPNKNGKIVIREQANSVIDQYRNLLHIDKHIRDLCGELNYQYKCATDLIPGIETSLQDINVKIERNRRQSEELDDKFQKEHSKLFRQISVLEYELNKISEKKKQYEAIDINKMIERQDSLPVLKKSCEELKRQQQTLLKEHDDITDKYNALKKDIARELEQFTIDQTARKQQATEASYVEKSSLSSERDQCRQKVYALADSEVAAIQEEITSSVAEKASLDQEVKQVRRTNYFTDEISAIRNKLSQIEQRGDQLVELADSLQKSIDSTRDTALSKEQEIRSKAELSISKVEEDIRNCQLQIDSLNALIDNHKGSLLEWLDSNKKGWQKDIGKIIDEERVLYANNLFPALSERNETSLFGVTLDLTAIDHPVRTLDEIKDEKKRLEQNLKDLTEKRKQAIKQLDDDIDANKAHYSKQVRDMGNQLQSLKSEQAQLPSQKRQALTELNDLQKKAEERRQQTIDGLQNRLNELCHKIDLLKSKADSTLKTRDKKLKSYEKEYLQKIASLDDELNNTIEAIDREISAFKDEIDARINAVDNEQKKELDGKGVDTKILDHIRIRISQLEDETLSIEKEHDTIVAYRHDKKELFDNEGAYVLECEEKKRIIEQLEEKQRFKSEKLQQERNRLETGRAERTEELSKFKKWIETADQFYQDPQICPEGVEHIPFNPTTKGCDKIVSEITSTYLSKNDAFAKFKQATNLFRSNFSQQNIFQFKTDLHYDSDFIDFAIGLSEFIEEEKINEFKNRVSERYFEIIRRVAKEVGDMTSHNAEVNKTINEINDDFVRKNFAGVIKSIELRTKPTSNRLMQRLLDIKKFHEENEFSFGESNLFTDESNKRAADIQAVKHLSAFMSLLKEAPGTDYLTLSDTFNLEFRIVENDNDSDWSQKISNVGSDGTDVLVKAMVNIMLINVFKTKISKKFGDFKIHCMMDEIGKLHPSNVKGILSFANDRNILLVNSSPMSFNPADYKHAYVLEKKGKYTVIHRLFTNLK